MMNGCPAKFSAIASLLFLILMGESQATSGLIPAGGKELYGSRKTFSRKEGCFGIACQRKDPYHDTGSQMLEFRLRRSLHPPPPPINGPVHGMFVPPSPPPPPSPSLH